MNIERQLIGEAYRDLLRLTKKVNKLESRPYDFGMGEMLYPSEIHAIEEIGKKSGETVTELCRILGVTKGAVSQSIRKLEIKGYIKKEYSTRSAKEKLLSLTEKGNFAYNAHASFHHMMDSSFVEQLTGIDPRHLELMKRLLGKVEAHVDRYLASNGLE